jgi:hypothetical protein
VKRLLLAAALVAMTSPQAGADVDRNYWRSSSLGVEVSFPSDWAVSEQGSYPFLLASAVDYALGGRMTLTVELLGVGERLRDVAERNRAVLIKLGYKAKDSTLHATGAVIFEAETPDRRRVVRQAYRLLEDDEQVFVITLVAPREAMQRYRRAFDDTLRGLNQRARSSPTPAPTEPTP